MMGLKLNQATMSQMGLQVCIDVAILVLKLPD